MVNKKNYLGILVIVLVFGFFFMGCEEEEKEKEGITISGTPKIGNKITAKVSGEYLNGPWWELSVDGTEWSTMYEAGGYLIFGLREKEITIPSKIAYQDKYEFSTEGGFIRAYIKLNNGNYTISNVLGPIQP